MFRRAFRLRVWGEPKKSGKTFLAAFLILQWAFTHAHTEIIVVANDLDQAVGRVFRTIVALLKHNPALGASATILATEIRLSNGTVITAIASEYKSAAGSRHSLVVFDELWGYDSERAQRLYEELTPPPTEPDAWVLVVSYAGFTGESTLLESMYQRGLGGTRVDDELELYEADGLFMFWSHTPRMPWQTEAYYAEQRRSLRPATYARLHENRWVSAESTFLTPELWDACVDREHHPLLPSKDTPLFVGVDAGIRDDCSAIVAVYRAEDRLALALHRIWTPRGVPLDLEETIESYLRHLHTAYCVQQILCDPYQLHRSITLLRAAGLPIEEFPQTQANTVRMGQGLYELLKGVNLRLYPSDELRAHALNVVAVESSRGYRLAKEKATKKIDAMVALSMACVAALDAPKYVPARLW
jgi:phage terminase large subunit-like protein